MTFTENHLVHMALAPDADRYNGDPATDIYNLKHYGRITFLVLEGAGGTGTATITIEECDDTTPSNNTAIAFNYRVMTSATTTGTWGAWTAATSSGVAVAAGANKIIAVEVEGEDLADGYPYVRLVLTESVDDPVDAGVLAILSEPRHAKNVMLEAVA